MDAASIDSSNHAIEDLSTYSFALNTNQMANRYLPQPYLMGAAEVLFRLLPNYLVPERCKVIIHRENDTGFTFERLGIGTKITFDGGVRKGQSYVLAIHFFGNPNPEVSQEQRVLETSFHNHLLPLAIYPFHREGRVGELSYLMEFEHQDPSGASVMRNLEPVRFGRPYVLPDPNYDYHRVITSGGQHLSLVVAHINGAKNPRLPEATLTVTDKDPKELIQIALEAHANTLKSLSDRARRQRR